MSAVAPPRRTQQQRREQTIRRLLEATIECLVAVGYAKTSTNTVLERSGLSRGALLHHFPTRSDLLVAAVEHLARSRDDWLRRQARELPADPAVRLNEAIRLMLAAFETPLFLASMELWAAARTDPDLRSALLPHERWLGKTIRLEFEILFGPELAAHPRFPALREVLMDVLRGYGMLSALDPQAAQARDHAEAVLEIAIAVLDLNRAGARAAGAGA